MYSSGGGYNPPSGTTPSYRTLAPRPLARPPTLLSDIAEHSPNPDRTLRSISVASFLSDGTIEIDGFGFETLSEFGEESTYGESLYGDSMFEGQEGGAGGGGGEYDLSRRAERILANAKRKLDLCGQNISRARSSLILSPSATPTALLDHLVTVGPTMVRRAESAGGMRSQQWRYNNTGPGNGPLGEERGAAHIRTASESAVHTTRGLGMVAGLAEDPRDAGTKQQPMARSNSTQTMRALRDQMKDLRGKIATLQEQTKSDSLKRRQSVSSMRSGAGSSHSTPRTTPGSTPGPYDSAPQYSPSSAGLEEIRESRVLNIKSPIEHEWEHVSTRQQVNGALSRSTSSSDGSGTPTAPYSTSALVLRRDDVNSPLPKRIEYRSDAFSYEKYLFRESIAKELRPTSMSSVSTITSEGTTSTATATNSVLRDPRNNISVGSISSYATADETHSGPRTPQISGFEDEDRRIEASLRIAALCPPASQNFPMSPREWAVNGTSPKFDDGYHSGPNTPRPEKKPKPDTDKPMPELPSNSWYRESTDTTNTRESAVFDDEAGGFGIIGGGVAIASSKRDSQTMVVGGLGIGGQDEIKLKIGRGDRALIEGVIEALGRVCCAMEGGDGKSTRAELRERLRGAMNVLEGQDPYGEMF